MDQFNDLFTHQGRCVDYTPTDWINFYKDTPFFCYVESGEIDLFFLETDPQSHSKENTDWINESSSQMTFFRTIKKEEITLSFSFDKDQRVRIIGIPNSFTKLYYLPHDQLIGELAKSKELNSYFLTRLENWFNGFSELLHSYPLPFSHRELSAGSHVLVKGENFICRNSVSPEKKHQLFWIKVKAGSHQPLNISPLTVENSSPSYPATRDLWFNCCTNSEVEVFDNNEITFNEENWQGWNNFFEHLLVFHSLRINDQVQKEKNAVNLKKLMAERNLTLAERQLQTVFEGEQIFIKQEGVSLLYDTCQLIGNNLNIGFDPSAKVNPSYPVTEQVEQLCFDSHVYQRLIQLVPNWFKDTLGPLLNFLKKDNVPLALIPQKGHYRAVNLAEMTSEEVSAGNANKLAMYGFEFFRAFPFKERLSGKDLFNFASFRRLGIFIGIIFLSILIILLNLIFPFFNRILFDLIIPNGDTSLLKQIFVGMVLISLGSHMLTFGREYIILRLEGVLDREFESAIWQRVFDLPIRFFRKTSIGDMLIRVFSVNEIRKTIAGQGVRLVINSLFSLIYLVPMLYYSKILTLAGLATSLIGVLFSVWAIVKNLGFYKKILDLKGRVNNLLLQLLAGISKIRTYGAEKLVFVMWEKIFYPTKKIEWHMQRVNNLAGAINFTISSLGTLVIYATTILLMQSEKGFQGMTMGYLIAFLSAYGPFSSALSSLSGNIMESIQVVPLWAKSQLLLKVTPEVDYSKAAPSEIKGNIHIDHVSFRYDKNTPYILNDISMEISEGEFIGIVGLSGSGKSTLIRLLIGFEIPENGAIYYENKDLATLDLRKLRRQIGIVLQNSSVIDGTIQENISTSGFYTEDQIKHALALAGFEEDLKRLPMGIHTLLMDKGHTLSGGQRQRLIIARALISEPKVLIFDEATNALDNATQEIVSKNLEKLNVTRIVVAHRLSRLKRADKIYVLNNGCIEDIGTFDELAKKKGIFSELLAKQKVF